jgi:hypothetical protein
MQAVRVVTEALTRLDLEHRAVLKKIPEAAVSTDDLGGVRVSWRVDENWVRANFGAAVENLSYIYFECGAEHGVVDSAGDKLAERLTRLIKR